MAAPDTRTRILDATVRALGHHGIARLSLDDVATEAGVSRQTVYRYFGSKDGLLQAAILREEEAFLVRVQAAVDAHTELRPSVEAAITEALRAAREHPLLDRLLESEPAALLPFLTTGRGPVLTAALPVIEAIVARRLPHLAAAEAHRAADALHRLIVSYAINPPDAPLELVASELADLFVHGLKETP